MAIELQPGKYANVKAVDFGIGETKAKKKYVFIELSVTDSDGDAHTITWFGYLNEGKARETTIRTLVEAGLKSPDLNLFQKGAAGGAMDLIVQLSATLEVEEYTDDATGITSDKMKVRWLNGPRKGISRAKPEEVASDPIVVAVSMELGQALGQAKSKSAKAAAELLG